MGNSTSNLLDEVENSDGCSGYTYNPELFDIDYRGDENPSWFEVIKSQIDTLENFQALFDSPWGVMQIFHYRTQIGCCYHYGSHIDIEPKLIRELDKTDFDLEVFCFRNRINFEYAIPSETTTKTFSIEWEDDLWPVKGYIDGSFFRFLNNSCHGDYLEIVCKNRLYHSHWEKLPDQISQYFEALWRDIKIKQIHPLELCLASEVGSFLPPGFRAYSDKKWERMTDQCKVMKGSKHCYRTHLRSF